MRSACRFRNFRGEVPSALRATDALQAFLGRCGGGLDERATEIDSDVTGAGTGSLTLEGILAAQSCSYHLQERSPTG
jgi:hypothetical protein